MATEVLVHQALLPNQEEKEVEIQNEKKSIFNFNQLKSFEILKSAVKIFTSNTKFMLFMIFSTLPFFAFRVFYELKLYKAIYALPMILSLGQSPQIQVISSTSGLIYESPNDDVTIKRMEFFYDILQLCLLILIIYPIMEIITIIITIKIAAKAHTGDKQATLQEVLYHENSSYMGPIITCVCVNFLSSLTLLGLFWIVDNYLLFSFSGRFYDFISLEFCLNILSIVIHSLIFVVLLYKYFDWSAFWNMAMVISVLEDEFSGIGSFGLSGYYGKHSKRTGVRLMLVFFAFDVLLRLPCLIAGLCDVNSVGILVIAIVIGFVCLGNLVKWVAFVCYFYDCKQQTLEKKGDIEVGKAVNSGDI